MGAQRGELRLRLVDAQVLGQRLAVVGTLEHRLQHLDAPPMAGRHREAPGLGRSERAHHVELGRDALGAVAGAATVERLVAGELALDQVGQLEPVEHELEELVLGELEDEIVDALAAVARLGAAATTAALRARDAVSGEELLVPRVHRRALAAGTVMEDRLGDVVGGDRDLLAALDVGDAAPCDRIVELTAFLMCLR